MPLQPRFYSISSSPRKIKNEINLTVAVVRYRAEDGEGAEHYGVCSNYLQRLDGNDNLYIFVRRYIFEEKKLILFVPNEYVKINLFQCFKFPFAKQ